MLVINKFIDCMVLMGENFIVIDMIFIVWIRLIIEDSWVDYFIVVYDSFYCFKLVNIVMIYYND